MKDKNEMLEGVKHIGMALWSFLKIKLPIFQILLLYVIRQAIINEVWKASPKELLMLMGGYLFAIWHVIMLLFKVVL